MLAEILANTRAEVDARRRAAPLEGLRTRARPTTRSFAAALRARRPALILECKHASPSAGRLRADVDLAAVADAYGPVADAVSVLTDTRYFGGSRAHLTALRERLAQPLLCKDFVVSPYQIYEARAHGADAALLMLSVLDDRDYGACARAAAELSMDVLTEVHDELELERALRLGARIVGLNNRDLRTLRIDLGVTQRLAALVPEGVLRVAESGIETRKDLRALAPRVDAFLVGSSLMRAPRPDLAARALGYGRVKICGLTRPEDARRAWACGASFGGLVLAPGSPRRLDVARARAVAAASPLPLVGVFVDASIHEVAELASALDLCAVQLHGAEDAAYLRALRAELRAGVELWKAVPAAGRIPTPEELAADRVLLDTPHPTLRGGTGARFDWSLLRDLADRDRYVIAGGIAPEHAAEADALGVYALDVGSGVEASPGVKDATKLSNLFAALRTTPANASPPVEIEVRR